MENSSIGSDIPVESARMRAKILFEMFPKINPNRSLEKNFLLFLMTAIRKSVLYMFDT